MGAQLFPWIVVIVASAIAAAIDVRSRRIPNSLTGPLLLCGLVYGLACNGASGLQSAGIGAALAGIPFIVLWLFGASGAGDAKLMLALGAWLAIPAAGFLLLSVCVAGGVLSLAFVLIRQRGSLVASLLRALNIIPLLLRGPGSLSQRAELIAAGATPGDRMPYGVAICAGTCASMLWVMPW